MLTPAPERLVSALADRYRIEGPLGEGGMAAVYLAEDLKHERRVAIKVLRPELAAVIGGERFVAEIKTTAKLQHPHILPLFDSGEADGFLFYVMPYVEGESLRDRLNREKQLGVEEALTLTASVADALDYAHRNGVIHRDIKPANILLHDGRPIVADFGIAVAISAAGGGRLTETGLSLGTPHYMSPEQATADRDLTARSDVYSLACVLYEMLTGDPPHTASTAQAVLVRILTEPARPVTSVRASVPPHVNAALAKALQKLPADRFRTAAEFRDALQDEHFTYTAVRPTQVGLEAATHPSTAAGGWLSDVRSKVAVAGMLGLGLVGLVAGMALSGDDEPVPDAPVYRYAVEPLQQNLVFALSGGDVVAYQSVTDSGAYVRIRRPDDPVPMDLPGTRGGMWPVFSPDGDWLAFSEGVGGGLRKIQLSTSTVLDVLPGDGPNPPLPTQWTDDGYIIFHVTGEGIYRVAAEGGGEPELLVAGGVQVGQLLPNGRSLAYMEFGSSVGEGRVLLRDLEEGTTDTLATLGGAPKWASSGHILYGHPSGTIFALPFDLGAREATGPARPVQEGVRSLGVLSLFALSTSGSLAYVPGGPEGSGLDDFAFGWIDEDGAPTQLPIVTEHPDGRLSPDGDQIAYTQGGHIYIFDVAGGTNRRLTFEGTSHHDPVWSHDGSRLAFQARGEGEGGVYIQDADGGSPAELVAPESDTEFWSAWEWLDDGTLVLMRRSAPAAPADLFTLRLGALDAEPAPILQSEFTEMRPALSPDGELIAYLSDAAVDGFHVFVRRFPGMEGPWQISEAPVKTDAFEGVVWASDGSALYYHDQASGEAIRAWISREPSPRVSTRDAPFDSYPTTVVEDAHPDGRRFLASWSTYFADQAGPEQQPLTIAVNWLSQLRRRLGEGG